MFAERGDADRRPEGVWLALHQVYFHERGERGAAGCWAAETADERQSAGAGEEDKAESVKREAEL